MGQLLDLDDWPRRSIYTFFLGFEDPWFSLTTEVEVGPTQAWCRAHGAPFSLAVWFAVLKAANAVAPFRMRLRPEGVWVHDQIRVGATVLKPDQAFTYVYFPYAEDFSDFVRCAQEETARRLRSDVLEPTDLDDLLHCTMVPWVRFTGIKHARPGTPGDSVPKIAVGRATQTTEGVRMPVAVDGHHALLDGVHVGAFLERLEHLLATPADTLAG